MKINCLKRYKLLVKLAFFPPNLYCNRQRNYPRIEHRHNFCNESIYKKKYVAKLKIDSCLSHSILYCCKLLNKIYKNTKYSPQMNHRLLTSVGFIKSLLLGNKISLLNQQTFIIVIVAIKWRVISKFCIILLLDAAAFNLKMSILFREFSNLGIKFLVSFVVKFNIQDWGKLRNFLLYKWRAIKWEQNQHLG